jgi:protein-tyrosine phosphatase
MSSERPQVTGYLNFRDLGGHATPTGVVRYEQVYRSDSLSHCNADEVAHLIDVLGVTTIIDLRHGDEIASTPLSSLEAAGIRVHHVPLVDPARSNWKPLEASASLAERYEFVLETAGDQFTIALRLIAEASNRPVVFQCMAGKDRTGLLAAVLLGLLGVDDDTVAADYERTTDALPAMLERWAARGSTYDPEVIKPYLSADAATMHHALAAIRARHGTIERYVLGHGLEPDKIELLRATLIDTDVTRE